MTDPSGSNYEAWPSLPLQSWKATCETLHLWTQIVGKVRLVQSPWINHSWHVTLYVTSRGLTTSPVPSGNQSSGTWRQIIKHATPIRAAVQSITRLPE